ncbi:MAG: hypothetical protein JWN40_805 [Phycisphaerales bacterium]|nr:hypothetical protein [Phycisphaerales bacterium]
MSTTRLEKIGTITEPLIGAGHKIEGGLGMFFGTLLTLMFAGLIVYMNQDAWESRDDLDRAAWGAAAAGWLFLDIPYLIRLWRTAFRGPSPITFETANRQRVAPLLLRPPIALWWFAHFAAAAWFSLLTTTLVIGDDPVIAHSITFLLATSYGYAANGYLMNAVCALTRSPGARLAVWRWRGLIDVALGVAGALLPPSVFK